MEITVHICQATVKQLSRARQEALRAGDPPDHGVAGPAPLTCRGDGRGDRREHDDNVSVLDPASGGIVKWFDKDMAVPQFDQQASR